MQQILALLPIIILIHIFLLNPATCAPTSPFDKVNSRATSRVKATTATQSISNWVEDVQTVNSFLNVALGLPLGPALKAGASKALAFAQDEPTNNKFLGSMPGLDQAGKDAAATLDRVFPDVLAQLGDVVNQPLSLPVAVRAVARINVNRCVMQCCVFDEGRLLKDI